MKRHAVSALALLALSSFPLAARADKPAYAVDDTGIDCHFEGDASRNFIIDDRGGRGEAYDFEIQVGGGAGNHSFCPHCRLALFATDLDVSVTALGKVGQITAEVNTIVGLGLAIDDAIHRAQDLVAAIDDGEAIDGLESLKAAFEAGDLSALKDKLSAYVTGLMEAKDRLKNLGDLVQKAVTQAVDLNGLDLGALASELGVRLDSGFRASFDDQNDPRKFNSGIKVYSLDEIIEGLVNANVPELVQGAVKKLLSAIPSLPGGLFEMSGDDDDVTKPVKFHGKNTDLTVLQRSYVVPGNNTVLLEWTVVNETDRVFPLVELAMMNDFDIPPLSYDKETDFDPITHTAMVYDEHPYLDPVKHYYFGFSPVIEASPDPTKGVTFASYNLDSQFSLAQFGTQTTEDNRMRFFLFDPTITGDHDIAQGKSEKQGAISVLFPGPLMPGQSRSVAFCVAEGDGSSKTAAKAEMMAKLVACKGLYTVVTATCGNGEVQLGELCDDGNTANGDGCSASCMPETCGDEQVTGAEECDDGNDAPNDGCSPTCKKERCGDGLVQTGEQCDDGDTNDHDGCLSDCNTSRCGDGVVRECDAAGGEICDGPCTGGTTCLTGPITIDYAPEEVNGQPTSGVLFGLKNVAMTVGLAFDVVKTTSSTVNAGEVMNLTTVETGPVTVTLTGAKVLTDRVAPALQGLTWQFILATPKNGGEAVWIAPLLIGYNATEGFGLELTGTPKGVVVGADGFPVPGPLTLTGSVILRRYDLTTQTMTDYASGGGTTALTIGAGALALEACDDGNASDVDDCTTACQPARCGDGFLRIGADEQCDEGEKNGAGCSPACQLVNIAACGNGTLDPGEQCDDKNTASGDGCSALCASEVCGDGVLGSAETCDDGNVIAGDGCAADCTVESCGDGIRQGAEACDDGPSNSETGACLPTCLSAVCGDGVVLSGVEACDDGNVTAADGCSEQCVIETCGDGKPGPGEQCDDGNDVAGDGCGLTCALEYCGDGLPGPSEQCDDGNAAAGDGCGKQCELEFPDACGNSKVGPGEQCDDGGTDDGDGCSALCQLEALAACGDGKMDPGEQCDDGGTVAGDGCTSTCAIERCGDGIQQPGEQCDDGDTESGDGCSSVCLLEPSACGNGVQEFGEQCDDGNTKDGDDCDATCHAAPGAGALAETCGNGEQDPGEQCDDGGRFEGDGCDETCQLEAVVCGNHKIEFGEGCDDGGVVANDGCSATCQLEAVCGNDTIELGEACDDGATVLNDGCNSACKKEFCGDGVLQSGESCDTGNAISDTAKDACRTTCKPAFCGDGVEDSGECGSVDRCETDCKASGEPKPDSGACGRCDVRKQAVADTIQWPMLGALMLVLSAMWLVRKR